VAGSPAPSSPPDDFAQSDPTVWWYCFGVSADQLTQFLKTNQARLVDLEVEQAQPVMLFSAVAVANQAAYGRTWWWYYGLDDVGVQEKLATNNARPIALKAYSLGGDTRFAVVMVSNKPPDNRTYFWFPDVASMQQVNHLLQVNQARLVDVDPYLAGGERRYALIMVDNTGPNQVSSSWLDSANTDQLGAAVTRTNGRVLDIEPFDVGAGTFDAVLQGCPCASNWWAAGLDAAGLTSMLEQTHARITSLASYAVNGQRRFTLTLVGNT
jgi:hypothetical protein